MGIAHRCYFVAQQTAVTQVFYVSLLNESKSQHINNQVLLICSKTMSKIYQIANINI